MSNEFVIVKREVLYQAIDALSEADNVLTSSIFAESATELRAALEQPGVENAAGWKLVPVEPTPEMAMAFAKSFSIYDQKATFPEAVKAMLEAAPQPAQQPEADKLLRQALEAMEVQGSEWVLMEKNAIAAIRKYLGEA